MNGIKWPKDVGTWIGFAGLILTAVFQFSKGDVNGASQTLFLALGMLGIGGAVAVAAQTARAAEVQAGFAARDTQAIRNDPSMPGPALTPCERHQRLKATNGDD